MFNPESNTSPAKLDSQAPETSASFWPFALTIIIPLRVTDSRSDLIERISHVFADPTMPGSISVLVVDDGSPPHHLARLREAVGTTRAKLISTGAKHYQTFSIARARNCGAQAAASEYILFWDADLLPYSGFFADLFHEIGLLASTGYVNDFLMIPCIYLTENGYAALQQLPTPARKSRAITAMLAQDKEIVEKASTGTSVILLRRDYYLVRGGNDIRFVGWGFEDYEFTCRLIRRFRQFPLPANWQKSDGNFMTVKRYEGWKSVYRLHGEWLARKGIWLFHVPHRTEAQSTSYKLNRDRNWRLFLNRLKEDAAGAGEPPPLADLNRGKSLVLSRNPFTSSREILPYLGEVIYRSAEELPTTERIGDALKDMQVSRVVFSNPYRSQRSVELYDWCRENHFPILVCERGALPDSVYYDSSGFLDDSESYKQEKWDRPLTPEEREAAEDYINSVRAGDNVLEQQAKRTDPYRVREKLGLQPKQKMLLVPFQQPKDTVIEFFSGPIKSFGDFYDLVAALPSALGDDWLVVYKKHPVEDDLEPIPGAVDGGEFNIYDLLEVSDAVLVINSGTGLLGMMFGKPVYILGRCWYAGQGMNVAFSASDDIEPGTVSRRIKTGFELDYERVIRFVHYLRFRFYSFGVQQQRRVRYEDGSPITATTGIEFYEVRGFTANPALYRRSFTPIGRESPMFDRYDLDSPESPSPMPAVTSSLIPCGDQKRNGRTARELRIAKWRKFRRDPKKFLADSNNLLVRLFYRLFMRRQAA